MKHILHENFVLTWQLVDCRSKLSSQETTVKDLREATDRHKETEARQASLISSLRECIHNTEQEMISITSSKNITDMKLQALTKENEDLKAKLLQMEIQSKLVGLFMSLDKLYIPLYTW